MLDTIYWEQAVNIQSSIKEVLKAAEGLSLERFQTFPYIQLRIGPCIDTHV